MTLDWLLDPWSAGFMRRALVEAILAGALCGALGCFVLVRGLAFFGESISHTIVLGVAVAFLAGLPVSLGAAGLAAVTVLAVQAIGADGRLSRDTAIGIVLPSLFGAGVALIAVSDGYRSRLEDVLFGSILAVTDADLILAVAACVAVAGALGLAGKELALVAFDRSTATAMGYSVRLPDLLLLALVALAAVVALRAVGNLLLTALLVGPPVIARVLCRRFWPMVALAAALGGGAGIAGLYATWYLDVGAGPAIALVVGGVAAATSVAARARRSQRRRVATAGLLVLLLAGVTACGSAGTQVSESSRRLAVVATTMPLQDFAREVGGERVHVVGILGPDSEPHEYEPTPSDADAVSRAEVVVQNGAGLDDWLGDLLAQAGSEAQRVDASEGIELLPTEDEGFAGDPHVWHDPERAHRMVDNVAAGLSRADPPGRATYEGNAAAYKRAIERMAARIRSIFEPIPPERRNLVTSHDAFGYFARAYDVQVVGSVLPSITTDTDPSGRRLAELVAEIRRRRVGTIFTEAAVDPKLERQVAAEAGARVSTSLYADALGRPGSGAETFVEAELANAKAMLSAWRPGST